MAWRMPIASVFRASVALVRFCRVVILQLIAGDEPRELDSTIATQ